MASHEQEAACTAWDVFKKAYPAMGKKWESQVPSKPVIAFLAGQPAVQGALMHRPRVNGTRRFALHWQANDIWEKSLKAALAQACGIVASTPCAWCSAGRSLWGTCNHAPKRAGEDKDIFDGACPSCVYSGQEERCREARAAQKPVTTQAKGSSKPKAQGTAHTAPASHAAEPPAKRRRLSIDAGSRCASKASNVSQRNTAPEPAGPNPAFSRINAARANASKQRLDAAESEIVCAQPVPSVTISTDEEDCGAADCTVLPDVKHSPSKGLLSPGPSAVAKDRTKHQPAGRAGEKPGDSGEDLRQTRTASHSNDTIESREHSRRPASAQSDSDATVYSPVRSDLLASPPPRKNRASLPRKPPKRSTIKGSGNVLQDKDTMADNLPAGTGGDMNLQTLKTENDDLREENADHRVKIQRLEAQCRTQGQELLLLKASRLTVDETVRDPGAQRELQRQLREAKGRLRKLEADHKADKEDTMQKIADLQGFKQAKIQLERECTTLAADVVMKDGTIKRLASERDDGDKERRRLQESHQKDLDDLRKQLKAKIVELDVSRRDSEYVLKEASAQHDPADKEARDTISRHFTRIKDLEEALSKSEDAVREIQTTLGQAHEDQKAITASLEAASREAVQAKQELARLRGPAARAEQLQGDKTNLEHALGKCRRKLTESETSANTLQSANVELQRRVDMMESEVANSKKTAEIAARAIHDLRLSEKEARQKGDLLRTQLIHRVEEKQRLTKETYGLRIQAVKVQLQVAQLRMKLSQGDGEKTALKEERDTLRKQAAKALQNVELSKTEKEEALKERDALRTKEAGLVNKAHVAEQRLDTVLRTARETKEGVQHLQTTNDQLRRELCEQRLQLEAQNHQATQSGTIIEDLRRRLHELTQELEEREECMSKLLDAVTTLHNKLPDFD